MDELAMRHASQVLHYRYSTYMFIPIYESGANNAKCNRGTENGENSSRLNGELEATTERQGLHTYNHQAQGSDSRLPR